MSNYLTIHKTTELRPQTLKNNTKRPPPLETHVKMFIGSHNHHHKQESTSPRSEIMNAACDAWWENRLNGNADYTPPWITLPEELNHVQNKSIRKVNFENQSPVENIEEDM